MAQLKSKRRTTKRRDGGQRVPLSAGGPRASKSLTQAFPYPFSDPWQSLTLARDGSDPERDAAETAVAVLAADGRRVYANPDYVRLEEALQKAGKALPIDLYLEPDNRPPMPQRRELTVELEDGARHFAVERQVSAAADGAEPVVFLRLAPLPAATGAWDRAARAEERFRDIARLVSDWVWETDAGRRLVYVSPRVTSALGYHPQQLLGLRLEDIAGRSSRLFGNPDDEAEFLPFRDREIALPHQDGSRRIFRLSGLPVYDRKSGKFLGYRGTAQDVTNILAHETALEEAVHVAEAANRTKSEILANTSHELRTPLNAIIGFSELMLSERFGKLGSERYSGYVQDILESANHLLTLINDILDVAKIEAGKLILRESVMDPLEMGQQTLRLVTDRAAREGVALRQRMDGTLPGLLADEGKIKQILLNLLSNAVKFTERDGWVELSAYREAAGDFCFAVRDTGIGIALEDQATALAPFGQVDSQLTRKFEGTGLGLPLSSALARLHGGSLELDSTPGQGTTATLRLPARRVVRD